jgi:tetratricopeptide (TPR) repeat protein
VIERLRRVGLHPSIILALVLMSLWMVAYRRLQGIGMEFYEPSIAGVRAFALYLNGRYGEAARAYRQAHRGSVWVADADDPTGAFALAVGDGVLAQRRAQATLEIAPSAIEPRVTLAEVALDRGDLADASRELTAVLTVQRDHAEALYLSAVVHGRAGRAGEAIDALNRALRSGNAGGRRATPFRLLELAGDLEGGPAAQRPRCLLAHLFRYLRIFDDAHATRALTYAAQAVAANDRPADAWLTIAIVQDKLGRHEAAMQAVRHALVADPRHAEAYRWAAVEARKRGDLLLRYRMIRKAFESALTDPFYVEDLGNVVLGGLGDPHLMAALMEQALAADPNNAGARKHLAAARLALGSPQTREAAR